MSMTISEYRKAAHPFNRTYTWPGGYPVHAITDDGAALCSVCVLENRRAILHAIAYRDRSGGWQVIGFDVNWEDSALFCDNCGKRIESAYAEDDCLRPQDSGDSPRYRLRSCDPASN